MNSLLKRYLLITVILTASLLIAQRPQVRPGGIINGWVLDSASSDPLEYANVIVYKAGDSSFVSGATSDDRGKFVFRSIRPGRYYIDIKFMGYTAYRSDDIVIDRQHHIADLGKISLERSILAADEVEVVGNRPLVEYRIDKKIVNVTEDYANISGTAVDILENVPSLTVDLEGNVSLRGSSSFTVLIDDRPTALDANDALQQIPASTIENIEIITNPSAKYDPDGVSGIINVVTKKRRLEGVSGIINSSSGFDDKYGADVLLNYRNGFGNLSFGANFNQRSHPGESESRSSTYMGDTVATIQSDGNSDFQRRRMGINAEAQLFLSPRDNLNLGFRTGDFRMERGSELNFTESWEPQSLTNSYISTSSSFRGGRMIMLSADYSHDFKSDAELSARAMWAHRGGDEESENRLLNLDKTTYSGQINTEEGPGGWLRYHLNFTKPLAKGGKFESGYQGRQSSSNDVTGFSQHDSLTGAFITYPDYSHDVEYSRNTQAIFGTLAMESRRFGYQLGLRSEYTGRSVSVADSTKDFSIDRWDLFPTLHASYKLTEKVQLMASYARRIDRPRGWYLEPFISWSDAYNVRIGNPGLKPEYINSYEFGIQLPFRKNLVSLEAYFRETTNLVERIHEIYTDNIMLHSIANVGTSKSTGLEMMVNVKELSWWDINIIGNLYAYSINGDYKEQSFDQSSDNWSVRLNNTFRIGNKTRIQVTGRYRSPSISSQGTRKGYYTTNLGIKQNLVGRKLSATLQVRDIFGTAVREHNFAGPDFDSYRRSKRESPVVMLTLSYNFNNFAEQERRMNGNGENGGDEFEEEF